MSDGLPGYRLYLLRLLYLANFVLLGKDVWPSIVSDGATWTPVHGVAFAFWGALSLLSGLGIRYPVAMLPLLLMQLFYKLIWVLAVALPQWPEIQTSPLTQVMLAGIVVDLLIVPWPWVFRQLVLKPGDTWAWTWTRSGS